MQGFPPYLAAVANIADSLRTKRRIGYISLNRPSTFVKCELELVVKFNCKYNYKRALYKDPKVI